MSGPGTQVSHLKGVISKLEHGRGELLQELCRGAVTDARAGFVFLDLDAEQTRMVTEYADRLARGDNTLPVSRVHSTLQAQVSRLEAEVETWKSRYASQQLTTEEAQQKLTAALDQASQGQFKEILESLQSLKAFL